MPVDIILSMAESKSDKQEPTNYVNELQQTLKNMP